MCARYRRFSAHAFSLLSWLHIFVDDNALTFHIKRVDRDKYIRNPGSRPFSPISRSPRDHVIKTKLEPHRTHTVEIFILKTNTIYEPEIHKIVVFTFSPKRIKACALVN